MIAPWTHFWNANVFIGSYPAVEGVLASPFLRGAVSGIGAITTLAGLAELATAVVARYREQEPDARG